MVNLVNIKENEDLSKLNHSCAHLLAQAVKHLYPNAKFWVGPVIEDGFYYDIDLGEVVIIEDVTTAGTSIEETLPIIKAQGDVNPIGLVVSVDRMERGQGKKSALTEIQEEYGIQTTAIVTMAEVVEHLYNKEYKGKVIIDDKLKAAIDAYYDIYGVK